MSNYIITDGGELKHYGVKGMKWGVRRENRQNYRDAKKELRTAKKELRKSSYGMGIKAINRYENAEKKVNAASMKALDAKVKYKTSAAKNAEKAEFKAYTKEMRKTGLPGSAADRAKGNRSRMIYDNLKLQKGKDYADRVAKKVQNQTYAALAASAVVAVGSSVALAMLDDY